MTENRFRSRTPKLLGGLEPNFTQMILMYPRCAFWGTQACLTYFLETRSQWLKIVSGAELLNYWMDWNQTLHKWSSCTLDVPFWVLRPVWPTFWKLGQNDWKSFWSRSTQLQGVFVPHFTQIIFMYPRCAFWGSQACLTYFLETRSIWLKIVSGAELLNY